MCCSPCSIWIFSFLLCRESHSIRKFLRVKENWSNTKSTRFNHLPDFHINKKLISFACLTRFDYRISIAKLIFSIFSFNSYVLSELGHRDKLIDVSVLLSLHTWPQIKSIYGFFFYDFIQLPKNDALSGLCNGMIEAWNLQNKKNAAILFVIEDVTYNICDQVWIQTFITSIFRQIENDLI